jgi:hypothetical protein
MKNTASRSRSGFRRRLVSIDSKGMGLIKVLKIVLLAMLVIFGLTLVYEVSAIRPVREVFTFTTIDAPKQQVWQVLTNFSAYHQWNPLYTEVEGKCLAGARIRVRVQMGDRTLRYAPEIRTVVPQGELAWNEHLILRGLFDGEHHFVLESIDGGHTRLVQQDRYSGALVPPLMKLYQGQAEAGFRRMDDALKKRVEQENRLTRIMHEV